MAGQGVERNDGFLPEIRVGRIDVLIVHQVSEEELKRLHEGSPQSLDLVFSTALLSTAFSFLASLLTASIPAGKTFTVFLIVTIVGFVMGAYLFLRWYKTRNIISKLVNDIRKRLPPEGNANPSMEQP